MRNKRYPAVQAEIVSTRGASGAACSRRALQRTPDRRRSGLGFTMVELMITIAIAAALIALAVPVLRTPRTSSEANALLGTLQLARSTAIKQGTAVIVCPSTNPGAATPVCSAGATSWSTGWIVLVPASHNCTSVGGAAGDQVVQTFPAFSGTDTAVFTPLGGNTNGSVCFQRSGFAFAANTGLIQIDSNPSNVSLRRCVILSGVGHAQVVSSGASDINSVACP